MHTTSTQQQIDENTYLKEKVQRMKQEIFDLTDRNKQSNQNTSK